MATRALRPPSILLVSNSVDERVGYARSLRVWGYRVVNAATTVLAYQIATTRPTDMVVTDVHCSGSMSGLELTRRLRMHTRTTTVPIIVFTSVTRRHDANLSIKAGADMFLERPVSGDVLREHVAQLLGACGRCSRHSPPPPELLNFTGKATNRPSSQTASPFQGGASSPAPVSGSQDDMMFPSAGTLVPRTTAPVHSVVNSWSIGTSRQSSRWGIERSAAARAFALRVWLVL